MDGTAASICLKCGVQYYQDEEGATSCKYCPEQMAIEGATVCAGKTKSNSMFVQV